MSDTFRESDIQHVLRSVNKVPEPGRQIVVIEGIDCTQHRHLFVLRESAAVWLRNNWQPGTSYLAWEEGIGPVEAAFWELAMQALP